jgi:hypothetical protein
LYWVTLWGLESSQYRDAAKLDKKSYARGVEIRPAIHAFRIRDRPRMRLWNRGTRPEIRHREEQDIRVFFAGLALAVYQPNKFVTLVGDVTITYMSGES